MSHACGTDAYTYEACPLVQLRPSVLPHRVLAACLCTKLLVSALLYRCPGRQKIPCTGALAEFLASPTDWLTENLHSSLQPPMMERHDTRKVYPLPHVEWAPSPETTTRHTFRGHGSQRMAQIAPTRQGPSEPFLLGSASLMLSSSTQSHSQPDVTAGRSHSCCTASSAGRAYWPPNCTSRCGSTALSRSL